MKRRTIIGIIFVVAGLLKLATMWGILPAKGFWVNHARNVHFENVCVKTLNPDQRPLFFKEDCE